MQEKTKIINNYHSAYRLAIKGGELILQGLIQWEYSDRSGGGSDWEHVPTVNLDKQGDSRDE